MAFDFPNTPNLNQRWPDPPIVGQPQYKWNGSEWTAATFDPAGYVMRSGDTMTGLLSLSGDPTQALHAVPKQYIDAQRQRISLAGGKSFDVQVPAGASAARFSSIIFPSSASLMTPFLQVSLTPGVFLGQGNYITQGYLHSFAAPSSVSPVNNATYVGVLLSNTHGNHILPAMSEGLLTLKRPNTTTAFKCKVSGATYETASSTSNYCGMSYLNTAQPQLSILALRLLSDAGDNWAAESQLNIEWL